MKVKRANSKIFYQNNFFYLFNFVSIEDDGCSPNALWPSFSDICKSDHYALHFKFDQF